MLKMKILVSSLLFLLMLGAMGSSYGQPGCVEGEVGCALEENAVSGEKRPQSSLTGQPPLVSPAIYQKAYQLGGFLGDGSRFAPKGRVRQSAGRARFQVNVNGMVGFSQRHTSPSTGGVMNQSVIMPAFRWTGKKGVNAAFWNGIAAQGGGLLSYVAFGSYEGTSHQTQRLVRRDEDLQQMQRNREVGIKSLGYTYTRASKRALKEVFADIDNFVNFYGRENIAGYFIDEVVAGNEPWMVDYMRKIYEYIKSKYPEMLVLANNGWGVGDAIAPYADIWMAQEVTADEYINRYRARTSEFEKDPANASRILHVIHSARPEQYEEIIRLSRERNAGNLFITTDTNAYPSGYDDLPTYFESLLLAINNFTPTKGSLLSPENLAGDGRISVEMPRSKVDLDLALALRSANFRYLENTHDGQYQFSIGYMGNFGGNYKDATSNVRYNSGSDGILLHATGDFGRFAVGAALGYLRTDADYYGKYRGVREKLSSYQVGVSGKFDCSEAVDLTGSAVYTLNTHRFSTTGGRGAIARAEFTSQVLDVHTRVGYRFSFSSAYVKLYAGLGMTRVEEGRIGHLLFSGVSKVCMNGSLGAYGERSFGRFGLFGAVEYGQRFSGRSYHAARGYSARYSIAPLDYASWVVGGEVGLGYSFAGRYRVQVSYGLNEMLNHQVRVGVGTEF